MNDARPLTCKELVELVTEYFDDALAPQDRTRFEEHVLTCPPCRAHLDQMRRTIAVVGRLSEEELSPAAEQDLLEAFRHWRQGPGPAS
jgi:anti-sigma factor RsiW